MMMRKKRRSYLDHFHKNAAGEYIYSGEYYDYDGGGKPFRRAMAELWLCCGLAVAATVAGGCIPVPGMSHCAYVLLPYVIAIIAAFSVVWSLGQLAAGGMSLREYIYAATVRRLPRRFLITAVFSGLTVLGEGVYLILHGPGDRLGFAVVFLVLGMVAAGAATTGKILLSGLSWSKSQKNSD